MTSKRTVLPDLQEGGTASDGAARGAGSYGHCEPPRQWPGLAARTGRKNGTRLVEPFFVEPALPGFLVYEVTEPAIRRVPSSQVGSDLINGVQSCSPDADRRRTLQSTNTDSGYRTPSGFRLRARVMRALALAQRERAEVTRAFLHTRRETPQIPSASCRTPRG